MLTRRHIRVKVLQSVYAFNQSEHLDLNKQEKFLFYSIDQMLDLYLLLLQLLIEMRNHAEKVLVISQKKHLATALEKNPHRTFIENKVLKLLATNSVLTEMVRKKKIELLGS